MKTEIGNKVKTLVDTYQTIIKNITAKIKEWEKDTVYSDTYKAEAIKVLQNEAIANDKVFNEKLKQIIAEEKATIIGEPDAKPADYQLQVANALKFLELAGSKLNDDQAYNILKPFQNDFETMKLFQSVVGNMVQPDMFNRFDKTFGKTNNLIMLVNSFEIAEKTVDNLFNSKDTSLNSGVKLAMFMDSVNNIEKLADTVEA